MLPLIVPSGLLSLWYVSRSTRFKQTELNSADIRSFPCQPRARQGRHPPTFRKQVLGFQLADRKVTLARANCAPHTLGGSALKLYLPKPSHPPLCNILGDCHSRPPSFRCVPLHSRRRGLSAANHQPVHCCRKYRLPSLAHGAQEFYRGSSGCVIRSPMPAVRSKVRWSSRSLKQV